MCSHFADSVASTIWDHGLLVLIGSVVLDLFLPGSKWNVSQALADGDVAHTLRFGREAFILGSFACSGCSYVVLIFRTDECVLHLVVYR